MKPNYQKLYDMTDPFATRPIRLESFDDEWLGVREARQLLRGALFPGLPLKLHPAMGGSFVDLLWSTFSPIHLISQRLADLFTIYALTGWSTYPVIVFDREGKPVENYFGLAITGKAGDHDLQRVKAIEKPPIVPGGTPYTDLKGLFFENDEWDGNDFCLMGHTITIIVTEKVKNVFDQAKIRNVKFTRLDEVETNAAVYEVQRLWPIKEKKEDNNP